MVVGTDKLGLTIARLEDRPPLRDPYAIASQLPLRKARVLAGTCQANEGISIQAIREALKADPAVLPKLAQTD